MMGLGGVAHLGVANPSARASLLATDFSEYPVGVVPGDWTTRWGQQGAWSVAQLGGVNVLRSLGTTSQRRAITWDQIPSNNAGQILAKIQYSNLSVASVTMGPVASVSGAAGSETGGGFSLYNGAGNTWFWRYHNGTSNTAVYAHQVVAENTWYWLRELYAPDSVTMILYDAAGNEIWTHTRGWPVANLDVNPAGLLSFLPYAMYCGHYAWSANNTQHIPIPA